MKVTIGRCPRWERTRSLARSACLLLAVCLAATPCLAEGKDSKVRGFVDGTRFIDIAGEDAVTVEVSLQGPLLRAIMKMDDELGDTAVGLESIHAVILGIDESTTRDRMREVVRQTERELTREGWQVLLRAKDAESEVKVLVLAAEEVIEGLVVMIIDREDDQLVFANIAGALDLAAIESIGEKFDVPGLEDLELEMRD